MSFRRFRDVERQSAKQKNIAKIGLVNSASDCGPNVSIVQIAGSANKKFKIQNPMETSNAELSLNPVSMKVIGK